MNWKRTALIASAAALSAAAWLPAHAADWQLRSSKEARLLPGPLSPIVKQGRKAAEKADCRAMTAAFRAAAGLDAQPQKGVDPYEIGPLLSTLSRQCAQERNETKRAAREKRIAAIVAALTEAQEAGGTGSLLPDSGEWLKQLRNGEIQASENELNGEEAPFRRIAELLAGLRDASRLAGSADALTAERKFADFLLNTLAPLDDAKIQTMLACDHGRMAEVLVDLSEDVKDWKYADGANRFFSRRSVIDPLKNRKDELAGLPAAPTAETVLGLARMREARGDFGAHVALDFFLEKAVRDRMSANGSIDRNGAIRAEGEIGVVDSSTPFDARAALDLFRLAGHGFIINVNGRHFELAEQTVLNGFLPLFQARGNASPAMAQFAAELPEQSFASGPDTIWINHFWSAELVDPARELTVRVESDFPKSGKVVVRLAMKKPQDFTLRIRKPLWTPREVSLTVNGEPVAEPLKDIREYIPLRQVWKNGDVIELTLPFRLQAKEIPGGRRVVFFHGPLLLGAILPQGAAAPTLDATNPDEAMRALRPGERPGTFLAKGTNGDIELAPVLNLRGGAWTSAFALK